MNRKWIAMPFAGLLLAGVIPLCASAAEVQLTVSVPHPDADGGMATTRLRLGTTSSGSAGFDPSLDLEAFPSPGLTAAVRHPEYPPAQQSLWWDLRADAFPQVWEVEIVSDQPNAAITLNGAAPASIPNGCSRGRWTLRDSQTNQTIELGTAAMTYSYPNTPGVIRRFIVTAAEVGSSPPPAPLNLWSPRQGRSSVYLAWSGASTGDVRYHVYRETDQGSVRLTAAPIAATSYVDTGVDRTNPVAYRVTGVAQSGCESAFSAALTVVPHR